MMFRYVCVTLTFELLMYIHLSALISVYMNMLKCFTCGLGSGRIRV